MLGEVAVIVTFLFLSISSTIFFKNEYEISTLVSIIVVFLSGPFPACLEEDQTENEN